MSTPYLHVEIVASQHAKRPGAPCGDVVDSLRTKAGTVLLCADGIGSGARAHIAARMCAGRVFESLRQGFSLRKAFTAAAATIHRWRDPAKPYVAFSLAKVRPDGSATVLCYDAPPVILLGRHEAVLPETRPLALEGGLATEVDCKLAPGEGVLLMSDGITQSGLGRGGPGAWEAQGALRFVSEALHRGLDAATLPGMMRTEALRRWHRGGDDCSAVLARCRRGAIVNLLTGPPRSSEMDEAVVERFLRMPGLKIVCGGTTADIVSRQTRAPLEIVDPTTSLVAPPHYRMPGIDLVTEGTVTLNQVYNLLDEDPASLTESSGVSELLSLLGVADRVNILCGTAENGANRDIVFRQRGVVHRSMLLPLLADRLRRSGKLVALEYV